MTDATPQPAATAPAAEAPRRRRRSAGVNLKSETRQVRALVSARLLPEDKERLDLRAAALGVGPSTHVARLILDDLGEPVAKSPRGKFSPPSTAKADAAALSAAIGRATGALIQFAQAVRQETPHQDMRLHAQAEEALTLLRQLHPQVAEAANAFRRRTG